MDGATVNIGDRVQVTYGEYAGQIMYVRKLCKKTAQLKSDRVRFGVYLRYHQFQCAPAQRAPIKTDTVRIDALQELTKGYGKGWILRESSTGRGMRLHETEAPGAYPSVRQAIDAYLDASS